MWFRKASARRQAIREDVAEAESLAPGEQRYVFHVAFIAAIFFVIASAVQFWPGILTPYWEGERAPTEIRSPVAFTIVNPAKTEDRRRAARAVSPPVLVADSMGIDRIVNQLVSLKQDLQNARSVNDLPANLRTHLPGLTDAALRQIQTVDPTAYATAVRTFAADDLRRIPFVTREDFDRIKSSRVALMTTRGPVSENVVEQPLRDVIVVGQMTPEQRARLKGEAAKNLGQGMGETVATWLATSITTPTYVFDAKLTVALADLRASQVLPADTPVAENDVIVRAGEKITPDMIGKLVEAQETLQQRALSHNPWALWLARLGRVLTVLLLTVAGALYVVRMNTAGMGGGGARTLRQGWAVCGLLLAALILARAIVGYWPQSMFLSAIAPTLFVAGIMAVAYNPRFAFGMAGLHGLLVVTTLGLNIEFFIPLLTGAAVYSFGLNEIRTRSKLFQVGILAGAAIFASIWAVGLAHSIGSVWTPGILAVDPKVVFIESLWGAGAGILVSMIMSAALPAIERIFKITTAMTLLELCDANKPLLRRLQQEAPGTFNHSLTVGIMAEAAGNAIGANGLLCRVGAYYHDVGKLSKPQYFIENQAGGAPNRHEKLSPAMSLLIIVGHVKDGIELAREYSLPLVVHDFIAQHHGTTLVEYFYHAARKRKEQEGDDTAEVSETEFRYPGPKPQTRETAIVMICDACESIVRSIDEPTPGRIAAAVHTLIMKRLMDGQFSACDLTLRALSIIEETLIRTLVGIHHGRVAYPSSSSESDQGDSPTVLSQPA